jgi:WD40 repeat protein
MNTSNMNRDDIQSSNYNPESNKEGYKKELSPNIIFQTDCPVRCVRLLNNDNEYKQNKNDNDMNDRNGRSSSSKCAIGCNDKSLKILDISGYSNTRISGEVVKEYGDVHRGSIYAMDHYSSAKGVNLIATVSNDKAVKILNLNNGVMSAPMKGHTGTIRDVSFRKGSDDLLLLATAGAGDNKGRIWDVSTGSSYAVLSAHTDSIHGLAWLGDEDTAGLILTGDEKGLIIAHDLRSSRPAWMLNLSDNPGLSNRGGNSVCCMESVSSMLGGSQGQGQGHGNDVVVGCTGGYVSIIDPIQRTINHIHKAHNDDVRNISVYDSKKFNHNLNSNYFFNLVATSFDNICSIWEIDRNNMSYNMKLNYMLKGHTDKVLGVSTRLDNGVLDVITTGADGKVILWK